MDNIFDWGTETPAKAARRAAKEILQRHAAELSKAAKEALEHTLNDDG